MCNGREIKAPGTRSVFLGFGEHFSSHSCSKETGHSSRAQITKRGSNLISLRMDQYFCSKGPNSFENIDPTFLGFDGPVVLGYTSQGRLEQNKLERVGSPSHRQGRECHGNPGPRSNLWAAYKFWSWQGSDGLMPHT